MNRTTWIGGGHRVALGEHQIWYRVDGGEGPTLLFAHGYPTSSHDYAPVIATLAPHHRCVSFDFLGFGASAKPRLAYSYALQHQVLARVVEAAQVTRAVLVVHDYAVTIGQDFLAETPPAPFGLDGVIFLNGGVDPAQHRPRPIQRFLAGRLGGVIGPRLLSRRAVLRALRGVFARKDRLDDADAWDAIASDGGIAVMPSLLHYMAERRGRRDALVAALGQGQAPRAFIWGLDDPVSGKHVLDAVRPRAPGAIIHELAGVGHYPQLEAPDQVAARIDELVTGWRNGA